MKKLILTGIILFSTLGAMAQVGIGTVNPEAILDVVSTDSGILIPRVATTGAVTTPVDGMIIYDNSSNCMKVRENGAWSGCLSAGGGAPPVRSVKQITTNNYTVLADDDILRYTAPGAGILTLPTGTPLGKEYVIVNNSGDGFSTIDLGTDATSGSVFLPTNSATTIIHIGGDVFAALHSY